MDDRELDQRLTRIEQKTELILSALGYMYDDERGFYLPADEVKSDE